MRFKQYLILFFLPALLLAQKPTRVITDASIPVGSHVTFSADTMYVLSGMVFVDSLATLTIEAGTIIKAEDGQDTDASGLVVTRNAKIFAEGTADRPIIFTSINDDLQGSLDYTDRGEWGGVVLLGKAPTNNGGDEAVEGVNEIDEHRALYGGDDPNHSSGVFRYVSIRHSGINIGSSTGNEIQGLTVGAVGAGTVLEYVESYASNDDGFEFFGGTVNTRYLVSAFCADDAFDWDQGFNGKHQFWFAIQSPDAGGRVAEMDGAGGNEQGTPYAKPILANVTYIGAGIGATPEGDGEQMLIFRDNTGGYYWNSIFTDYDDASTSLGITVEDIDNTGEKVEDSRKRLEAGDLALKGNIWYGFGAGNTLAEFAPQDFVQAHLAANDNRVTDPMLRGISRTTDNGLDPRPQAGSPALNGALDVADDYFVKTSYVGAFGGSNWLQGWTALDQLGYSVTAIVEKNTLSESIPVSYKLSQNYPNPFNPVTNIEFSLPAYGPVELAVYNMLGQKIATLLKDTMQAGSYRVTWDATKVASGMYVYKISAGDYVQTKRMLLIK
ncbi:MAG: T9SS type A sorting domain-containing protein [Calditrichae bacterium]|nr:T9SS type A sorting domain-containing protein [Calditrichia bacterium]